MGFFKCFKTLWSFRKLVEASQQDLEDWTSLLDPLNFFLVQLWKGLQSTQITRVLLHIALDHIHMWHDTQVLLANCFACCPKNYKGHVLGSCYYKLIGSYHCISIISSILCRGKVRDHRSLYSDSHQPFSTENWLHHQHSYIRIRLRTPPESRTVG